MNDTVFKGVQVLSKGRALQQVRPGFVVKAVLQGQLALADGNYVSEASKDDIYKVYAETAVLEKLARPKDGRTHRTVMSYGSFCTFFKFAQLLEFVEPTRDNMFGITEAGRDAWQEWEDLRRVWQILVRGVVRCSSKDIAALTHEGVLWLCQERALKHGLAPIAREEVRPLLDSGIPDLLLGDELGVRFFAVEVKPKAVHRIEVLRGIGQCASYKCNIPNVSPCLVISEKFSGLMYDICSKLSLNWMSVVVFDMNGQLSLVYGKDSFLE